MDKPTDVSEEHAAMFFKIQKWLKMEAAGSSKMLVPL
jgi:hypothetical protein